MGIPQLATHPQNSSRPWIFGPTATVPAAPNFQCSEANAALCGNSKGGNAQMAIPDELVSAIRGLDSVATAGVGQR